MAVSGLAALVAIQHQEPNDSLAVNGLGGNDGISAAALAAQAITLRLDGGAGDDTIAGARGIEVAFGGDGNDSIDGNGANDAAFLGAGDDTFVWDPGDGSDTVEGQAGTDTMLFNGANVAEQVDLSANGERLRFFRTQGAITMDTNDVEKVDFNALGGPDLVTVNDLTGTDVQNVNANLASGPGASTGDLLTDQVIVNATNGNDAIEVAGRSRSTTTSVTGLAATVSVTNADPATDALTINALAGNDIVDAAQVSADSTLLTLDGGAGDDLLVGGGGNDTLFGRDGDDVLVGVPESTSSTAGRASTSSCRTDRTETACTQPGPRVGAPVPSAPSTGKSRLSSGFWNGLYAKARGTRSNVANDRRTMFWSEIASRTRRSQSVRTSSSRSRR